MAKAGVKTCVCFECRYSSQFLATKAVIDRGLLGTIHYGEVDYYHGIGPWYGQFRWNTKRNAGAEPALGLFATRWTRCFSAWATRWRVSAATPPARKTRTSKNTSTTRAA
ncbi:MAG: hypothetical protein CM1200mP34_0340 [Verrucomicrobiales bacterium]|nr:MAG: hypothetical protein CM1200mP34_0340 [Verrucomicrobiales bacterium]